MSTYLDALLSGQSKARSLATNEDAVDVDVAESAPPNPGDVLTAVDSTHATWQPPTGGGGGTAGELGSTGAPINVDGAAPPVPGQVLTAVDPEHAEWRVPGLHYDPSIKFWTASAGSATIASGTWGFVEQGEGATDPIVVYIVSSLEAPPVDARFGLYVGRDVTVPVSVSVLGASQIQGLDGELGPSTALLPGADYEWVFYHEDGAALWGLVSDTAAIAKQLWVDGGMVELRASAPPNPGDVLTADADPRFAVWLPPSGGGLTFVGSSAAPSAGQWCLVDSGITSVTMPSDAEAGDTIGMFVASGQDGTLLHLPSGFELAFGNKIADPSAPLKLRGGAYYEWTLQPYGETSGRWLPRGMSNESPAPLASRGFGTIYPNEWVLSSDYSDVVNAPSAPQLGDCLAIYVNSASASVVPASGQSIVSPDGTTVVTAPSALTLPGNTYYEWIWVASASHWKPKNYLDAPGNGLIRSGKTLAVGANADASIVINADDIRVGVLATDAQHGARGGGTTHAVANSGSAGFMSTGHFDKVSALSYAYKEPVRAVATSNNTLSGAQTVDSILIGANERILCTAQTTASQNGIWQWSGTSWSRPSDANLSSHWPAGAMVPVNEGTVYADSVWTLTTNNPISLGTTSLAFSLAFALPSNNSSVAITPITIGAVGSSFRFAKQDHGHAFPAPNPGATNGFRLSHSASVPAIVDGTYSTIFTSPYKGNKIALWDTTLSTWQIVTNPVVNSANLSGHTAGVPVDVFARYIGSLNSMAIDLVNWTNASTRASTLSVVDGILVGPTNNNRYIGTFLPDSATTFTQRASASGASNPICAIWNQDSRIRGQFTWTPAFDSWTIPSADTWQQINAQSSAKIQLVQGQVIDAISARHVAAVNAAGSSASVGIGLDSTTAPTGLRDMSSVSGSLVPVRAELQQVLATPGAHTLNALAIATSTAAIFYGAHGSMQGGLTAELWY